MNALTARILEVIRTQEAIKARLAGILEDAQKDDSSKHIARHAAWMVN